MSSSILNPTALSAVSEVEVNRVVTQDPAQPVALDGRGFERVSVALRVANLMVVVLPFLGFVAAMIAFWGRGFGAVPFALLVGMYLVTVLGVTVGFHRLFTHRAFETHGFIQAIFAFCGSLALEGSVIRWVATHRRHHQTSDADGDPHSPHLHGHGFTGFFSGLWHAHCGWLFEPHTPAVSKSVTDLTSNKLIRRMSDLFPLWILVSLLLPTVLGGLFTRSWPGALLGFLWGGLARVFLVHHVTWSINSVCHLWGKRPFRSHDESRNNIVFGVLAMGEGWHNNHHAFPTSARHGLAWWQIDVSYWVIRLMELCGLAWNVRLPAEAAMAAKRRRISEPGALATGQLAGR